MKKTILTATALVLTLFLFSCSLGKSPQQEDTAQTNDQQQTTSTPQIAESTEIATQSDPLPQTTEEQAPQSPATTPCYEIYSGNLSPILTVSFEYPCDWTIPPTGGKITSPDGNAMLEYPAPDVGLPNTVISSAMIFIDGKQYEKTVYKHSDIFVEYIDMGEIAEFELDIIFQYKNDEDKIALYHMLETFRINL